MHDEKTKDDEIFFHVHLRGFGDDCTDRCKLGHVHVHFTVERSKDSGVK